MIDTPAKIGLLALFVAIITWFAPWFARKPAPKPTPPPVVFVAPAPAPVPEHVIVHEPTWVDALPESKQYKPLPVAPRVKIVKPKRHVRRHQPICIPPAPVKVENPSPESKSDPIPPTPAVTP